MGGVGHLIMWWVFTVSILLISKPGPNKGLGHEKYRHVDIMGIRCYALLLFPFDVIKIPLLRDGKCCCWHSLQSSQGPEVHAS
jgi:hypothetical protein